MNAFTGIMLVFAVSSGHVVLIFIVCKLVSGVLSMLVANRSMKWSG